MNGKKFSEEELRVIKADFDSQPPEKQEAIKLYFKKLQQDAQPQQNQMGKLGGAALSGLQAGFGALGQVATQGGAGGTGQITGYTPPEKKEKEPSFYEKEIFKSMLKKKMETPSEAPKGEVAGGGPVGLKTAALVGGKKVPIEPFFEKGDDTEGIIAELDELKDAAGGNLSDEEIVEHLKERGHDPDEAVFRQYRGLPSSVGKEKEEEEPLNHWQRFIKTHNF